MPRQAAQDRGPAVVKRYAPDRLYDATNGRYVSVAEIRRWAARDAAFAVIDSATGLDVTNTLLPAGPKPN